SGLAGSYTFTARDATGCTGTINVTVGSSNTNISLVQQGSSTSNTSCTNPNGGFTVAASGAQGPYTYIISANVFNQTGVFTGLLGGQYTVQVTSANECTTTLVVTVPTTTPTISMSVQGSITANTSCSAPYNGAFTVAASGGTGPYNYALGGNSNSTGTFSA